MTQANRKRYYLHHKLKGFVSLKAKQKTVFVTETIMQELRPIHLKYVMKLKDEFRYNIQYEIASFLSQ